jgi:hypothetical protein
MATRPVVVESWVERIEKFLKEQVWMQLDHEEYEAVIAELKKRL